MVRDDIFMINFNTSEQSDKTGKVTMGKKIVDLIVYYQCAPTIAKIANNPLSPQQKVLKHLANCQKWCPKYHYHAQNILLDTLDIELRVYNIGWPAVLSKEIVWHFRGALAPRSVSEYLLAKYFLLFRCFASICTCYNESEGKIQK